MNADAKKTMGARRSACRIEIALGALGLVWVFLTDRLVSMAASNGAVLDDFQTHKIWLYAAAAALFLYVLVRHRFGAETHEERDADESRRALEMLVSNLPGMAYRCVNDPDWTMEFVSDGCAELTGYGADDLVASKAVSYASLILDEDLTAVWDAVQRGLESDKPFQMSYRIRTASGATKRVWEQGRAVGTDEDGNTVLGGFVTDITEHMRVQRELDQSRRQYKNLVRNAPVGLCRSAGGASGRIVVANEAFARMLGYESAEEMLGTNVEDLYWDEPVRDESAQSGAAPCRVERKILRLRRRDGTPVRASLTTSIVQDGDTGAVYCDCVAEGVSES